MKDVAGRLGRLVGQMLALAATLIVAAALAGLVAALVRGVILTWRWVIS